MCAIGYWTLKTSTAHYNIPWNSPSYLLIKSSNHGLDPLHGFVSRHGRAEGHHSAVLVNPERESATDTLISAWK